MTRAIVRWTPPTELLNLLRDAAGNIADLSTPMEKISRLGLEEIQNRLARGGDGDWPALSPATILRYGDHQIGVGKGGGFTSSLQRSYSATNAVVISRAPHAHLFDEGTKVRVRDGKRVYTYSEGGKRKSRSQSRKTIATSQARDAQPARPFMYFSDDLFEKSKDIVIAHVLGGFGYEAAA